MLPDVPLGSTRITGETETYYILHGTGTYSDNGEKRPVQPGDITFCADGSTHGLENTGDGRSGVYGIDYQRIRSRTENGGGSLGFSAFFTEMEETLCPKKARKFRALCLMWTVLCWIPCMCGRDVGRPVSAK